MSLLVVRKENCASGGDQRTYIDRMLDVLQFAWMNHMDSYTRLDCRKGEAKGVGIQP